MDQKEVFTSLFERGFDYDHYLGRSDDHQERMKTHRAVVADEIKVMENFQDEYNYPLKILIIAENWCSDCANTVPIVSDLAEFFSKWEVKIVTRDENITQVEQFYRVGNRIKIPIIIFADMEGNELVRWIERPTRSYHHMALLKKNYPDTEEYKGKVKYTQELQAPSLTIEIMSEILSSAKRAILIDRILRNSY